MRGMHVYDYFVSKITCTGATNMDGHKIDGISIYMHGCNRPGQHVSKLVGSVGIEAPIKF